MTPLAPAAWPRHRCVEMQWPKQRNSRQPSVTRPSPALLALRTAMVWCGLVCEQKQMRTPLLPTASRPSHAGMQYIINYSGDPSHYDPWVSSGQLEAMEVGSSSAGQKIQRPWWQYR